MLPLQDLENVTYDCYAVQGIVLWQLNGYQLVDRDEFQTNGVLTRDKLDRSTLTIYPDGIAFLFGQSQSDVIVVSCMAVVDDVNLNAAPPVLVYADGQSSV